MTPEIQLLVFTAASIAFVHTLLGPDHYLPFVAMARARGWSRQKTLRITLWCGLGHLVGSVALGVIGIALGSAVARLEWIEGVRGEFAAWALVGFGLAYMAWGLRRALRRRPHSHWHQHEDGVHRHTHDHQGSHAHLHDQAAKSPQGLNGAEPLPRRSLTPWIIFVIFVLGPCEPLIPLLMYPAATHSTTGMLAVTGVFGLVTVATMLLMVLLANAGLDRLSLKGLRLGRLQRFDHALAGFAVMACGLAITLLGV